jgi:N-acetyl-anhydromuramyl-L-alanine amidase AmpD
MKKNNLNVMDHFRSVAGDYGKALLIPGLLLGATAVKASTDYAPAKWVSAPAGYWYTSGYGHKFVVIHDIEGYYLSCISMLSHANSRSVSVHYVANGKKDTTSDHPAGELTQMVREAYYAWHARCWNQYSLGTEHEGFVSNPAWFTEAMYVASAGLQDHMTTKFGIAQDRNHVCGHDQKRISGWTAYANAHFGSGFDPLCNSHTDPGAHWDWTHFMDLIKGTVSTPSAPSSLLATVSSASQINLAWTDNSGIETGFKVERSTSSGSGFAQIGTTGANIKTYPSTGLAADTTYYYRVRAYNASGDSGYSNTANGHTKDVMPAAPTSLTATAVSSSQINLAWAQSSANEDGFKIERSTDNTNFTQIATAAINAVSYSNTGLLANTRYYYRVRSYNTAGDSAYSNTANDITAPTAPSGLTATAASSTQVNLSWTDNSANETGFKLERGLAVGGPFSSIATNAAGVTTYSDTGRSANTAYFYRVASYNANGNSVYSAVASATTPVNPPVLAAIGNKTVTAGNLLTFTSTSTDPNHSVVTTTWQTFESFTNGTPSEVVMFNKPANSSTTSAFIDTAQTNSTHVTTSFPTGHAAGKVMKVGWTFKTGQVNPWVRLNTYGPPQIPNPTMDGAQILQFDIYATKTLKVAVGMRETGTSAAYGANGGTTGDIDWVGVTNVVSGKPIPSRTLAVSNWTTLSINIPFDPQAAFTGDGAVATAKGVLEHIALSANGNSGAVTVYMDNFAVVAQNTLTYSLDAGAPAGATINPKTGKFTWTPAAGISGNFNITVRVTDQVGATGFELIKVTVISAGNASPVLAAIGNKTVNELAALSFTATATDPDAGQTRTFALDAGAPSGAAIVSGTGAFSWTPTEAQGPGSYPITVRVTDNGTPASNDWETITVTVNEINAAPVLATIANQTVDEMAALNVTASATDSDLPANTLTYSLAPGAPAGMTIGSSSGAISWTPSETDGPNTYPVTVKVTDNGSPSLNNSKSFTVTVNEANIAPVLTIGNVQSSVASVSDFETYSDGTYSGTVMFHQPSYSSTTSAFLDTTTYNETTVESTFPTGNISSRALRISLNFKTGTSNPWCRLSSFNASTKPNPTIDFNQRFRIDVWTDKSLKFGLGVRETATGAAVGANGGTVGSLEYIGVTNVVSGSPQPSRVVNASNWTTLEFNMPLEACRSFTGNGILAAGKGVLEHLILAPNGGMGTYNIWVDNLQVVTITTNLVVDALQTITVTNTATDADLPAQTLTFSLGAGAPTNAIIDSVTGVFEWTPASEQSPSTNIIAVVATDDGPGNLSNTKNMTIVVNKVNTAPRLGGVTDQESLAIEVDSGEVITFTADAEDDDLPADTLTFSLQGTPPAGATINSSTGDFSWTPPSGYSSNNVTIRVTDNGVPPLYDEAQISIVVIPTNVPPALTLSSAVVTETVVTYESLSDMGSERVMFNKAGNSSTTSAFVDAAAFQLTSMTNSFPAGNPNGDGSKVVKMQWSFKTGTTNPWIRANTLLTGVPIYIKNPAIELQQTLRFDIYTTKSLKVGLGVRETGTTAAIGADGGTTGNIEWVGVTNVVSGSPFPSRVVNASNWTTLEFNFPTEQIRSFTGNGVLAAGRGVLEHLALIPNGGTGAYTVYVDNFKQISTTALPGTVTMNASSTLAFTASGTNPDAGAGELLSYSLDADANTNAVIDEITGAFTFNPDASFNGTTNLITVSVQDSPTNGGIAKIDSKDVTVIVNADPLGVQSDSGVSSSSAAGETTLTWDSVAGQTYQVQYKDGSSDSWTDLQTVTATGSTASVMVSSEGERFYRITPSGGSDQ